METTQSNRENTLEEEGNPQIEVTQKEVGNLSVGGSHLSFLLVILGTNRCSFHLDDSSFSCRVSERIITLSLNRHPVRFVVANVLSRKNMYKWGRKKLCEHCLSSAVDLSSTQTGLHGITNKDFTG